MALLQKESANVGERAEEMVTYVFDANHVVLCPCMEKAAVTAEPTFRACAINLGWQVSHIIGRPIRQGEEALLVRHLGAGPDSPCLSNAATSSNSPSASGLDMFSPSS